MPKNSGKGIAQKLHSGDSVPEITRHFNEQNAKSAKQDNENKWFHGRLTRGNAIHILKKGGMKQALSCLHHWHGSLLDVFPTNVPYCTTVQWILITNIRKCWCGAYDNGMFVVRESVNVPGSFVLSLIHKGETQHFQINASPHSGCFSIDNGPPFVGLDQLIKFYKSGSNGLPTSLGLHCPGLALPAHLRQYSDNTVIHQCIEESVDVKDFRKFLADPQRPHLDIRNKTGHTALHEAAMKGLNKHIIELYNHGADVKTRDADGGSALHLACRSNHPETCETLMKACSAKPQDRFCGTGRVPLHDAAAAGHVKCIKVLLAQGAAPHPRCVNGETPLDLARKKHHRDCVSHLDSYKPPAPKFTPQQYMQRNVDRNKAIEMLHNGGLSDGFFLVRASKRVVGQYVLTMSYKGSVYNYEIKVKDAKNRIWYYIDDGPLFSGLEYLIDYYCRCSDGLPFELQRPIMCEAVPKPVERRPQMPTPVPHGGPPVGFPPPSRKSTNETRIIPSEFIQIGRELGTGEFGSVLMGVWKESPGKPVNVALKTLHGEHINTGEAEFQREADVMMGLDHPCIVKLYGICRGETLMMVQELVTMGSALDFILDYPHAVGLNEFKIWAAQIASGMNYLEEKGFVHRDLALRNILLSSPQLIKISDFGLSRAVGAGSNYYKASAGGRWPVKWYAPESINYGTFSSASDVWSYAVTLWEMFSKGDQPYGNMTGAQVINYIEDAKGRLKQPAECPDKVYTIMRKCWEYEKEDRPTFRRLHQKFKSDPEYFNVQVPGHRKDE